MSYPFKLITELAAERDRLLEHSADQGRAVTIMSGHVQRLEAERDQLRAELDELALKFAASDYSYDQSTEQLRAEVEALRMLAAECNDYLSFNELTNIAHGSILHRKLADAAMAAKEG